MPEIQINAIESTTLERTPSTTKSLKLDKFQTHIQTITTKYASMTSNLSLNPSM